MDADGRWAAGDEVTLRYLTRDGRPGMAWPFVVVRDSPEIVALFIPANATYKRWGVAADGTRRLVDAAWRDDVLRLMFPGRGYSIWLFWRVIEGERRLAHYYINMEEPFRRSEIGFDTNDHTLDVVVQPGQSEWRWKDDEEFAARTASGLFGGEFAAACRAEAAGVIKLLERHESPFCDGWETWLPDAAWAMPHLSERWDTAPAVRWELASWAYGESSAPR